jgi:Eco57I restriction-modification methylase
MELRRRELFTTIRTEGAILPPDLLQRVAGGDNDLGGLKPADYHLFEGEPLNEAIVRSWNRLVGAWAAFGEARAKLPQGDLGTTITRERWLLILFDELGYGRLQPARAAEIEGKSYAASHSWGEHVPVHLVGCNVPLDRRSQGVAGAAVMSPHGLIQELLNRSEERLWGFVSNGLAVRVLRDNSSLTRQAYVEFDLASMMDGEVYADFVVLWLVCHESRVEGETPQECWLERWSQEAVKQGTRALDGLRSGVEAAIMSLGSGFLAHPANTGLREALRLGALDRQDYYRELLRLAYRLLFLFVAEDRGLLLDPAATAEADARYDRFYSTRRLRRLAERRRGSKHADLYQGLRLVMEKLGKDDGCPALGLPALGGYLWSSEAVPNLGSAELPNSALLEAVRALAALEERGVRRSVDYRNLGAEELGSVYESLLELHPDLNVDAGTFALTTAAGNERKTTGSYYTPTSLISCLLDSALDPVLDEAAAKGEQAILDLKVCDPACGSGHFLVAAAHRIAKRLASARTGDDEPSPEATRSALRDVVGRCVYGVDFNPMAVELCKVSLWMEALDPGKPLSFLDAHIKCGNSLVGTTVALTDSGVPDVAFTPLAGDDKDVARELRKRNMAEREGQLTFEDEVVALGELQTLVAAFEAASDNTIEALHNKEKLFQSIVSSARYTRAKAAADAWCASFVQKKVKGAPGITTGVVRRIATGKGEVGEDVLADVRRAAEEFGFFQWEIEFPEVFARRGGGFACVLGNPPWDQVQFREQEFFAGRNDEIAEASSSAIRQALIEQLAVDDPTLFSAYLLEAHRVEAFRHFVTGSSRFPLTGGGRVNLFGLFAEAFDALMGERGRAGGILSTGIATDDTCKEFFAGLMREGRLYELLDFENRRGIFPAVDSRAKFCLLAFSASRLPGPPRFTFYAKDVDEARNEDNLISLSYEQVLLVNPTTKTCPIFRSTREATLVISAYERFPIFGAGWQIRTKPGLFNMAGHSAEFVGATAEGYVPLYEGKMVGLYDHRAADVVISKTAQIRQGQSRELTDDDHRTPERLAIPRYWVSAEEVKRRLKGQWDRKWLFGWKEVTSPTNERTLIGALLPLVGVGHKIHLVICEEEEAESVPSLLATFNSFVCDFICRCKLGGTSLTPFVVKQLPIPTSETFHNPAPFDRTCHLNQWINPRVLELTYVAVDLRAFASDFGRSTESFMWDSDRRFALRCELDAAFFHLYGLAEEDVDYVMETFPIVKRRDEELHGHYRTKALILDVHRKMSDAIATGVPYETILDPPPADPRVAHASRKQSTVAPA